MAHSQLLLPCALFFGLVLAGCDGPCRVLANRICECEPNARTRASCVQELESNGSVQEPSAADQERCNEILDTCDCEALEREDFAACGLTKPARSAQP